MVVQDHRLQPGSNVQRASTALSSAAWHPLPLIFAVRLDVSVFESMAFLCWLPACRVRPVKTSSSGGVRSWWCRKPFFYGW